jgi:hypothetical protein
MDRLQTAGESPCSRSRPAPVGRRGQRFEAWRSGGERGALRRGVQPGGDAMRPLDDAGSRGSVREGDPRPRGSSSNWRSGSEVVASPDGGCGRHLEFVRMYRSGHKHRSYATRQRS